MAGSYRHIVNDDNEFYGDIGEELLIDDLGDAYEALEECYDIILFLSGGDITKIAEAYAKGHLQKRHEHWKNQDMSSTIKNYFKE